jgi:hypothetical protein
MNNYDKQLEDQNEELQQKLADTEKRLYDLEEKYKKETNWRRSVHPMPISRKFYLNCIINVAKKPRKRFVKLKKWRKKNGQVRSTSGGTKPRATTATR